MYFVAREIDSVTVFFISVMHVRESVVTADSSTIPDHPSGSRLMVPSWKGSALLLQFQGICLKQYGHFQKKARWCTFARECWQIISCLQDVGDEYRTIEAGASTFTAMSVAVSNCYVSRQLAQHETFKVGCQCMHSYKGDLGKESPCFTV